MEGYSGFHLICIWISVQNCKKLCISGKELEERVLVGEEQDLASLQILLMTILWTMSDGSCRVMGSLVTSYYSVALTYLK